MNTGDEVGRERVELLREMSGTAARVYEEGGPEWHEMDGWQEYWRSALDAAGPMARALRYQPYANPVALGEHLWLHVHAIGEAPLRGETR